MKKVEDKTNLTANINSNGILIVNLINFHLFAISSMARSVGTFVNKAVTSNKIKNLFVFQNFSSRIFDLLSISVLLLNFNY